MKIEINHNDELITSSVLAAVAKYFDGFCLPKTDEPKKYYFNPESGELKNGRSKTGESNVSLLFAE